MVQDRHLGQLGERRQGDALVWARWLLFKARKRARGQVCRWFYRDSDRDIQRSMLVAGAARSGTTWLADIIRSEVACRIVWEPFNQDQVAAFRDFEAFPYRQPADVDPRLQQYVRRVLEGDMRDPWIDREVDRIRSSYRLVKSVRVGLALKWVHDLFPEVPLVYVVRHPCAVVLSRMEANWDPNPDIGAFLAQPALIDDHLEDRLALIKGARTVEEKHAIAWCVLNLVPSRQFQQGELPIVFYEDLCLRPKESVPVVFGALHQVYHDTVFRHLNKPSRMTSRASAVLTGQDRVSRWKHKLATTEIRNVLSIVREFGLEHLYGDSIVPLVDAL